MRRALVQALALQLPQRWCRMAHESSFCGLADAFLSSVHQRADAEKEWNLDFSHPPALGRNGTSLTSDNIRDRCNAALAAAAAHSVERFTVSVSSPAVRRALTEALRAGQPIALRALDLTLHDVAFLRDDLALNTFFQAATSCTTRLESLRVAFVACDMQCRLEWGCKAARTLAALIPPLTLQVLSLEHVSMQGAVQEDLLFLCDTIARCHALTHLSLRGMSGFLSQTPFLRIALSEMRHLLSVDFGSSLSGVVEMKQAMGSLKASIGGWYRLQSLDLSDCKLFTWGLQLMHCDVAEMPPDGVARIEVLNLNSNSIDDDGAFVLSSVIMRCEMLRELHLRHNRISKKGAAALFSALVSAASLSCLNMHSNLLTDDGLSGMLQYAKFWPDLRRLDLTRCRLSARSLHTLCTVLPLFDRLQDITLDRNDFRPIEATLASNKTAHIEGDVQLFVYDPSFVRGGTSGDWKVPTSFELDRRDALSGHSRFKGTETYRAAEESCESTNTLTLFGRLGSALSNCRELRRLSLSGCSLSDVSFVELISGLIVRHLAYFDVSSNPLFLRIESVEALDKLLHQAGTSLQTLDLSCTGLGSDGVSLLADGVSIATSATNDVEENEGMSALRSLKALTQLRLASCHIGEEGFEALADALPSVTSLERLFLEGNKMGTADVAVSLLGALNELPVLKFVGLHGSVPFDCRDAVMASREYSALQHKGVVVHL